ncbi:MAG: hypothetical protein BWY84_01035 [Candidatus Aerophobetes bacterium ADurb.Bin490]|nr:MAG: hypothetical protein BWY84_01035 [Candidatus Aerophobetes bacterium ADurb.Bin490]
MSMGFAASAEIKSPNSFEKGRSSAVPSLTLNGVWSLPVLVPISDKTKAIFNESVMFARSPKSAATIPGRLSPKSCLCM